jgi:ligand-binding sensor protein/putative methionine-R-sulfoxide reductase with GAF domain
MGLSLKDFIDINAWQKIQDNFSKITDVCLRTVDSRGRPVTVPSKESTLCSKLLKDPNARGKVCGACSPTFLGGKGVVDRNLSYTCFAGLCNFVAPLRNNEDNAVGYLLVGPVILVMRKTKEEYLAAADELNIDLEDFWSAILEIKVISFQGMQSLIELIRNVGEYIIKLSFNEVKTERGDIVSDSPKLGKLLNTLLDVAVQISGADIGSIMFFDDGKDEMTIRASRGIPDEIVRGTRVKLGDGISGVAAQERRAILIDDNIKDNRIRPFLRRPYINSSMVIPINIEERVKGVISLGTLKTSTVRFNNENIQLMNKLIDLATVAFQK